MLSKTRQLAERVLAPIAAHTWRIRPSPRLVVLMYHRVLPAEHPDRVIEQPGMYVSPATLDMHLSLLRRHFEVVQLDEWLKRSREGKSLPAQACAITFDDGWRDNFEFALPVLVHHRVPATIFLVSGMVGTRAEFWPNRMARLLAALPSGSLWPEQMQRLLKCALGVDRVPTSWDPERMDQAISAAKQLSDQQVELLLESLPGVPPAEGAGPAMLGKRELQGMAATGLIRFGSHTRSHCRLHSSLERDVLEAEIASSYADISTLLPDVATPIFCYPNGETTPVATEIVRRCYLGAVTTTPGWHTSTVDPYLIRRLAVHEDISNRPEGLLARLSGWR